MRLRQTSLSGLAPHHIRRLGRSRRLRMAMHWALATVAPWALSTGLLVSFTASAGQPRDSAETLVLRVAPDQSSELPLGPSLLSAVSAFHLPALFLHDALVPGRYETARYSYEEPQRLVPMNEYRPRDMLKTSVNGFPALDRSKKTDPLFGLRPSLTQTPAPITNDDLGKLLFEGSYGDLTAQFVPDSGDIQTEPHVFAPFNYATTPQDRQHGFDASPVSSSFSTPATVPVSPRSAERQLESIDGSTPSSPRALVLSSSTPVPVDLMPVEIAAAPVTARPSHNLSAALGTPELANAPSQISARPARAVTIARKSVQNTPIERPNYAAMIGSDKMEREQRCLAEAVYYEARSEPEEGQAAVAQVVLNRVKSGLYPDNVCGVVYQNRHRYLACQFTFACEGRALRINEPESWEIAKRVAREVTEGHTYLADVGSSTHYHANYVRPWWARRLTKMDSIGRHVFYKLKPGQT